MRPSELWPSLLLVWPHWLSDKSIPQGLCICYARSLAGLLFFFFIVSAKMVFLSQRTLTHPVTLYPSSVFFIHHHLTYCMSLSTCLLSAFLCEQGAFFCSLHCPQHLKQFLAQGWSSLNIDWIEEWIPGSSCSYYHQLATVPSKALSNEGNANKKKLSRWSEVF